jgi:hypothetical protein
VDWIRDLIGGLWSIGRAIMRGIRGTIVLIWRLCRASWVNVGNGLRPNSLASAMYLFLYSMLFIIGLILVLLGFDLAEVDRWLDGHSGWFELFGTIVLKAFWAVMLLTCVIMVGAAMHGRLRALARLLRREPKVVAAGRGRTTAGGDGLGWGSILVGLILGYFAAIGLIM